MQSSSVQAQFSPLLLLDCLLSLFSSLSSLLSFFSPPAYHSRYWRYSVLQPSKVPRAHSTPHLLAKTAHKYDGTQRSTCCPISLPRSHIHTPSVTSLPPRKNCSSPAG